jgi:hypothetical protein
MLVNAKDAELELFCSLVKLFAVSFALFFADLPILSSALLDRCDSLSRDDASAVTLTFISF